MRLKPLLAVAVLSLLATVGLVPARGVSADQSSAAIPQLHKQGRWLVDQYGRVVIVHGVNLVWKQAPYVPPNQPNGFTTADADWLADHGFNGARLGTLWAGVAPSGPGSTDASYFTKWDRVVGDLAEHRIWMQFDFHQDEWNEVYKGEGVPAWAVKRPLPYSLLPPLTPQFPLGYWTPEQSTVWDNFWAGRDGLLDGWASAWKAVAAHWKDQPYSMGYDLLNEPWSGTEWPTCATAGCPDTYSRELQPAMTKALRAIRQVDPSGVVWFEPQQLAAGLGSKTFYGPVAGESQLGFAWHNYCPQVFLQSTGVPGTNTEDCIAYSTKMNSQALDQGRRMDAVGLMNEFGATDNVRALQIDTAAADDAFTSWMYWAYKVWNDPTTADTAQGLFTDDADLSSTKPKISTLVRTYAQSTCGTPGSMTFDPTSGEFHYTYVAGSCAGQPTEIFVSPLHYPNGYSVSVDGGTQTGTASHHRVLIQAPAGRTVTVTIARS